MHHRMQSGSIARAAVAAPMSSTSKPNFTRISETSFFAPVLLPQMNIVGVDENDVGKGRISWISPMAKALLQRKKGEIVSVRTPKGEEDFEILEVKYDELP